jgi:hypothetical protein
VWPPVVLRVGPATDGRLLGAVVGTIALIAIPSLIFGFWPQLRKAFGVPSEEYWDPIARSRRQSFYLWTWLIGCFPVGLLLFLAYSESPEGRWRRRRATAAAPAPEPPPISQGTSQLRRCRSCGAAEGEHHDPDRCTDQAALLRQAIDLTQQLIQMKEDEIFVRTGRGREDL